MSTYLSLHYHVVFSTKYRKPRIAEDWQARLHEYVGGTINGLGGQSQCVGGVADHVHLLFGLRATHCLSDFMRELKKATSIWVHTEIRDVGFRWQEGYSAFTVGATSRDAVRNYITRQEQHHKMKSFQEELVELLERAGVEYNPKYLN